MEGNVVIITLIKRFNISTPISREIIRRVAVLGKIGDIELDKGPFVSTDRSRFPIAKLNGKLLVKRLRVVVKLVIESIVVGNVLRMAVVLVVGIDTLAAPVSAIIDYPRLFGQILGEFGIAQLPRTTDVILHRHIYSQAAPRPSVFIGIVITMEELGALDHNVALYRLRACNSVALHLYGVGKAEVLVSGVIAVHATAYALGSVVLDHDVVQVCVVCKPNTSALLCLVAVDALVIRIPNFNLVAGRLYAQGVVRVNAAAINLGNVVTNRAVLGKRQIQAVFCSIDTAAVVGGVTVERGVLLHVDIGVITRVHSATVACAVTLDTSPVVKVVSGIFIIVIDTATVACGGIVSQLCVVEAHHANAVVMVDAATVARGLVAAHL